MRTGKKGIWIPNNKEYHPAWEMTMKKGTWIPLPELRDILEFALNNAFLIMPDGRILKQLDGIPMGDPLSPGMTIMTCAWMERDWMSGLDKSDFNFFKGARYMDDILLFLSNSTGWDKERFLQDFAESECYWKPLKLEATDNDKFLENKLSLSGGRLKYRLKNDNEQETKVWRYHDYRSRLDYTTKRGILCSTLRKVNKMASDKSQLLISGVAKCEEFLSLGYPAGILRKFCTTLAHQTDNKTWFDIREHLPVSRAFLEKDYKLRQEKSQARPRMNQRSKGRWEF